MPEKLIDGFAAVSSVLTQSYAGNALTGTAIEHGGWVNTISLEFRQDVIHLPKLVLANPPGWKEKSVLERDVGGSMSGFMSKGHASSMPGLYINGAKYAFTGVFDDPTPGAAGADVNSIAFDAVANSDLVGLVAKGNSNRGWSFESTGLVTKAWVVT